jgi:hypothetical protein
MSKQRRKDKNLWDRFMLWINENQKVIWVVLLICCAPFFAYNQPVQQLFSPSPERTVAERVYGRDVTQLDLKVAAERLGEVARVARGAFQSVPLTFPEASGQVLRGDREGFDPINFFMFREKARKLGLRVSDAELAEHIRELWQQNEAISLASSEVREKQKNKKSASDQEVGFEFYQTLMQKKAELSARNAFEPDSWVDLVRTTRLRVSDFEETLRDIYLIGKLESYVKSSVKVSPEEVYKAYREEKQKRRLTWVELKSNEALKEKVAKTLTADDVKAYYEGHKEELKKPFSMVRASWLLVPKDHFKEEVEKSIKDEDLKVYYQDNRDHYRRTILADEAAFKPRTPEEKQTFEQKLYSPLEEVKDKVREKVVEKKTGEELAAFERQVAARLFPPKPAADAGKTAPEKPATFEGLLKEFPFLKTGSTPYVSAEDAKAVFGDAYASRVNEWLNRWRFGAPKTKLEDPTQPSPGPKGSVFYAKVQERPPRTLPSLKEIETEVRDTLLKSRVADIVDKAAQALLKDVAEGRKDLGAVVASGLDVEVAGEKVHVEAGPAESSKSFLEKDDELMVSKPKKEGAGEKDAGTKGATDEEGDPKEEAHPASQAILGAVFNIQEMKSLSVAKDPKSGNCYLVRFDDVVYPDPANFEKEKSRIERDLLAGSRETGVGKEAKHFKVWRDEVLREALGHATKKSAES